MHWNYIADDKHSCAMQWDALLIVSIVVQCDGIALLLISIVVHFIGIALIMVRIVVQCYKIKSSMH